MKNKKTVFAYKGFNKDMTCNGFQYPESGEVHVSDDAKLCDHGVHACVAPLDVLKYYPPATSVYHKVKVSGVADEKSDDSKIVGTDISIGARIDIAGIVKAQFDYVKKHCTNENNAEPGEPATAGNYGAATAGDSGAATAGYSGAATAGDSGAATAGYRGAATAGDSGAATAGDSGAATAGEGGAATAGNYGAATAGYRGAATAGNYGAATAGYRGAATAGDYGAATAGDSGAATAGYRGAATSRGSVDVGANGVGTVRGNKARIKGGIGAVIVAVEECEDSYNVKSYAVGIVDGNKIKADTWYTVKDGEFEEDNNADT
jgi:hypothetical protein